MALLFQILSTRLGCVSDYDLAVHCRFALYDRPGPYKLWYRWGLLYPLYLMAEAGIIMTDLAELLGSAIAINLLVPAIPLWACVLLTSLDVFLILMIFNQCTVCVLFPSERRSLTDSPVLSTTDPTRTMTTSMRMFELLIGLLVLCVLGSFVAMLVKVGPDWGDAFKGYLPSSGIINNGAIYIAVGIIGATVMPHAFYIGSKMACMRRLKPEDYGEEPDPEEYDSDEYYSDEEEDDDDLKKGDDASAPARPGRSRIRSTKSSRRRDSAHSRSAARPYIPFLHLPQPMRMPNVGFDLGKLSRVRTESTERAAPRQRREEAAGWTSYFTSSSSNKKRTATKEPGTPELGRELERVQSRTSVGVRSAPIDDIVDLSSERTDLRDADAAGGGGGVAATSASKKTTPRRGRRRSSLACVRAHLTHACLDVAGSLLGFALVVNSAILILGAAVFYYGDGQSSSRTGVR